jgi:hypothetical protein
MSRGDFEEQNEISEHDSTAQHGTHLFFVVAPNN